MRHDNWEPHWPSDDELLGRAVVHCCASAHQSIRWKFVVMTFGVDATLANALVERYVDEQGNLKL